MKQITGFILVLVSIFFASCASEKFTEEQKSYTLPDKYEKISQPGLIYVSHISNDFVTVLDPAEMKMIGQIPCGKGSDVSIVSSDGTRGYIANFNSNDVTVYDTKTNKTVATVKTGERPSALLELPEQKKVLITHQSASGLFILNTENNSASESSEFCTGPMYYLKNKGKIYMPQIFNPYIYVLDPLTNRITGKIETGGRPMAMAFTTDNRFGYLANYDSTEVAKIDIEKDSVIFKIKNIPSPRGITITPDNRYVLVTNVKDNSLTIIDALKDEVYKTVHGLLMPTFVVITKDGNFAVVSNQGAAKLSIIDLKEFEIVKSIDVASNPISLFVDNR